MKRPTTPLQNTEGHVAFYEDLGTDRDFSSAQQSGAGYALLT
jgi:hypothetical protein